MLCTHPGICPTKLPLPARIHPIQKHLTPLSHLVAASQITQSAPYLFSSTMLPNFLRGSLPTPTSLCRSTLTEALPDTPLPPSMFLCYLYIPPHGYPPIYIPAQGTLYEHVPCTPLPLSSLLHPYLTLTLLCRVLQKEQKTNNKSQYLHLRTFHLPQTPPRTCILLHQMLHTARTRCLPCHSSTCCTSLCLQTALNDNSYPPASHPQRRHHTEQTSLTAHDPHIHPSIPTPRSCTDAFCRHLPPSPHPPEPYTPVSWVT